MALCVEQLLRTAATLGQALLAIARTSPDDAVMFDLFRNAAIKSFEASLERGAASALPMLVEVHDGSQLPADFLAEIARRSLLVQAQPQDEATDASAA